VLSLPIIKDIVGLASSIWGSLPYQLKLPLKFVAWLVWVVFITLYIMGSFVILLDVYLLMLGRALFTNSFSLRGLFLIIIVLLTVIIYGLFGTNMNIQGQNVDGLQKPDSLFLRIWHASVSSEQQHNTKVVEVMDQLKHDFTMQLNKLESELSHHLESQIISQQHSHDEIQNVQNELNGVVEELQQFKVDIHNEVQQVLSSIPSTAVPVDSVDLHLFEDMIQEKIDSALERYSADKVGLPDFALETAGAKVVSSSRTYSDTGNPFLNLLFHSSFPPSTILQPGTLPGQCWAFEGSQGEVTIRLSFPITPTQISIDHLSHLNSPDEGLGSAPQDFEVYGLHSDTGEATLLLSGSYDIEGASVQTFDVQADTEEKFELIMFKVTSNHGNPNYTCIYRLRVHALPLPTGA